MIHAGSARRLEKRKKIKKRKERSKLGICRDGVKVMTVMMYDCWWEEEEKRQGTEILRGQKTSTGLAELPHSYPDISNFSLSLLSLSQFHFQPRSPSFSSSSLAPPRFLYLHYYFRRFSCEGIKYQSPACLIDGALTDNKVEPFEAGRTLTWRGENRAKAPFLGDN